ncbi:DUF4118 domain-containing protein [Ktedonobacter robiniae]|uniref:Sensor protein KdpD transmembrane domain-containing protein n=1 Tax=Ktedonobacter robiniae TaxID=2778365 RepID=A0ABQ3V2Z4_9CHLR|nr:DUF4118 domain-containing protein [Ktedonobacter robiniae]GHO58932.1 hypothetical protein KSB_74070 [Ktedonobacter robiniae]
MQNIKQLSSQGTSRRISSLQLIMRGTLAISAPLAMTGIISDFQLYPRIPNISILYLLIILGLASLFDFYIAALAALTAFLAFDYFLVPPLYMFTINRWEEWIALFIFLATALLTSQLTVALRRQTARATHREREAKILYEMIHLTNSQESFETQVQIMIDTLMHVFGSWGIQDCTLLLPDQEGNLTLPATAPIPLTQDERMLAVAAMHRHEIVEKRIAPSPISRDIVKHISYYDTAIGPITILRFIPLNANGETLGIVCLRIQNPVSWFSNIANMQREQSRTHSRIDFFWTFLEQVASILDRSRLRSFSAPRKQL